MKDALILRFEQPVSAAGAGSFLVLKEAKSGERAAILVTQKVPDQLEISFPKNLKRGMLYQFIIKKGFCGSEGSTGTARDFSFSFATVPPFRYQGDRPLVLYPDFPNAWLPFSNALTETDPALITDI